MARNDAREGKKIKDPQVIIKSVAHYMEEWSGVCGRKHVQMKHGIKEMWKPPEHGSMTENIDGATTKMGDDGAGGVVYRDYDSAFRGAACTFFTSLGAAEHVELLACKHTVQTAMALNFQRLHIEMDCQAAVRMLRDSERNFSAARQVIEEVKAMLQTQHDFNISWVRSANRDAHVLAREGITNKLCMIRNQAPPECIVGVVSDEIPALF